LGSGSWGRGLGNISTCATFRSACGSVCVGVVEDIWVLKFGMVGGYIYMGVCDDWVGMLILMLSELAREKMWSRIHLIPLLTAEEDRDLARRHYADLDREQKLLGSQSSAYNSDRYVHLFFF
jgi:hypothetical protein